MTEQRKNELAELLMEYNFQVLKKAEYSATKDRNFDELKEIYKIQGAIDIVLESFEKGY